MELDPTSWLSSTVDSCCQKFFGGYNYDICMGRYPPDHDDCNIMLFYPDWEGVNDGCVHDGKQSQSDTIYIYCMHTFLFASMTEFSRNMSSCILFAPQK